MKVFRVAVLVTVYNRAATTEAGLKRFADLAAQLDDVAFSFFVVDDGSTDDTTQRLRALPLDIEVIPGTGSLYWNRGMALAYRRALSSTKNFDAYMLYNDDVLLNENFIRFTNRFQEMRNQILVGAFTDPVTGEITYSGYVRLNRFRPLAFEKVVLSKDLVPVDAFNGNLVAVPADIFETLGGLDAGYTHAYGDLDLGLRAKVLGVDSFVFGLPVGECERGRSLADRLLDLDVMERRRLLFGHPHGLHSYLRFARRHSSAGLVPIYATHETARRVFMMFRGSR